ncbi:histidine phosphatase family protein [Bacillus tianshenii]|uniref:histidine phosphatase family protein n=1 Tax=Sutcliffiella tianshenii TaxID=1463404 RepID=UPI001CD234B9|nr:histidine phosphatase family protein [Bacillus tianshenii]MCA1319364.1 histidine phosphatase family protein [Bacillus tianshenii]
MTKFGFIRHGSTAWNKERRAQGSSDIPLDQDGIDDAKKLAARLSSENWDYIFSSNLLRAKQTAEIVAEKLNVPALILDTRLREVSGGLIEGTTEAERMEKWGADWRSMDLGIEKVDSVLERGLACLNDIHLKHPKSNVLIVSHGSFIRHLIKELTPEVDLTSHLENTSITTLSISNDLWNCEAYNCVKHLDQTVNNG